MSDYKLVNIADATIEDISETMTVPVISGSSSSTYQTFKALSSGSKGGQVQFNIQIPSLQTAFSREVLIKSKIRVKVNLNKETYKASSVLFQYGKTNSLTAFPLNSSIITSQANINNCTVSTNINEIMPVLLP